VNNPLAVSFVLLSLAIPAIWLAGRALAATVTRDRTALAVLSPGVGLALWLLAIHVIGRSLRSFSIGLVAGTLIVASGGLIGAYAARRRGPLAPTLTGSVPPRWMWLGALVAIALMAPAAFLWAIHDEVYTTGHMSISAQMQNDTYPPRHMTFPAFELRYHYGFNLLVSVTTALTRLELHDAIDAVLLVCWGYSFCLAWALGERIAGRGRGPLAATVTLFGGGLPIFCSMAFPPPIENIIGLCRVERLWPNPPITSNFFQHPWTLGIPIGLCAVLVAMERSALYSRRLLVLGVLLTLLSMTQFVLFLTLSCALLAQELFASPRGPSSWLERLAGGGISLNRALALAALLGVAALATTRLGAFFAERPGDATGGTLFLHPGITDTAQGTLKWLFLTYGLLLPLGLIGLFFIPRARILLASLIGGSMLILCLVRVQGSWDIVKFATVAALALSFTSSVTIAKIARIRPRWLGRPLAVIALSGSIAAGVAYPIVFGIELKGIPSSFRKRLVHPPANDAKVMQFLRTRIRPGDVVYRRKQFSDAYAQWGGLPQPWVDGYATVFGFDARHIRPRQALLRDLPDDPDAYLQQGMRWLVLDSTDSRLTQHTLGWISAGRAREVYRADGLRVVEITPAPAPPEPRAR
jgi:hypothetical protein